MPYKWLLALLSALALIGGLWSDVLEPLKNRFSPQKELAADEKCAEEIDRTSIVTAYVGVRFCQTEFANIWTAPPQMFEGNRELLVDHFEELAPFMPLEDRGGLEDHVDESDGEPTVLRLLTRFGEYGDQISVVYGRVDVPPVQLTKEEMWNDWLVQLGTVEHEGIKIYGRFSAPSDWEPPPVCQLGWVLGAPIAEGQVQELDGLQTDQVIYMLAGAFGCGPFVTP